ncbi:hypothetical protein A5819_000003 [Enterococcus sp. 7E2_DIV0204]|uniref:hypothetical protein n=1 Tax=unclassified Enterococcus TaxID=2608891 RepID=UPI000A347C61|nr:MULTISPECIES: hypothetical protein [unclassified Enterococcus]OTN87557.1 hypothetical protein A5819_000003 [Enterococcus sp. 7E2_DIV0204]OTP49757.1 hypothetical protein A5884_002957 [Enterococcus sp. 7D2_DIV0200]
MDEYKIPFSSDLAGANETMMPFRAIAKDMNDKMQPTLKALQIYQQHFPSIHDTFGQVGLSINNIYAPLLEYQNTLLEATRASSKWHKLLIESDALKQIRAVSEMWKTNFDFDLSALSISDFRVGVVTQELEQVITENPEEVAEKLLFKEIPEPSNEVESRIFKILYEFRQVPANSSNISDKAYDSQSENVPDKKIKKSHDSPAFYKDKMWYAEVILGLMIEQIYNTTIGINPGNTIGFALLLSCFVRFISINDRK